MVKNLYIRVLLLFVFIPFFSFATHIVGGSLTYVYNGGSNYTITLKLYRDCGPGAAGFPANVNISVLGNNGQPFSPSKDITMTLGSVTNVPSNLDPCAVPPNPMPCVQEGIYTTTVNNLPPNAGGYHLYYQLVARNLSLTNINGACNCIGESFYANIPGMSLSSLWNENFSLANGTAVDNGITSWAVAAGVPAPASAAVNTNAFEITGSNNGTATWTSQLINISSCSSANLNVNLSETGNLDTNDSLLVYYRLNGGPLVPFPVNGSLANDFNNAIAAANGLTGTNVQIVIRAHFDGNSPNSENYIFDDVNVSCVGNDFKPNSNPVFNLFPPLFICVNQPFTFNHAATDADGDSLVYSLYTPYDGDTGPGALDPTFSSNTASFTPVTYLPGFNYLNPLGASPFTLNSSTGLLTGTPGLLGQFVVGVVVKEYRNGVYISQTLRDFQFNVLNCPQPPPALAVANATVNNGCSAKLTATGISSVSATWTSISPGPPGAYNSYLACTSGCLSNTVTAPATGTAPAFVDYVVCGVSTSCSGASVCDTFRVTFNPTLVVNILPSNPTLCFGQTSTTITAVGGGGTPPYTYLWNNVNPSQTINVGVGTYNVQLSDASGCPPVYNSVTVTAFSVAITANAGPNITRCIQSPAATLNGSVTGATGGIWSGGLGTFTPNNTTLLNVSYSPTPAELATGSATLFLTTTGNGSCPSKTDTVVISYTGFTGVATPSVTAISCFGGNNGSATINMSGGFTPYTYLWNTSPTQTTATASNLPIGTYSVTIQDGIGCTQQTTVTITQPPLLSLSPVVKNVSCSGTTTGSISVNPTGGTAPYTYSWSPGGQTTSSLTGLGVGTHTVTVTDSKSCVTTASFVITQPAGLNVVNTQTNVSCFNLSDGAVNTLTVTGGTAPYTYSWSPGGSTSPNATGLHAGTYTLTVKDNNGCKVINDFNIAQPAAVTAVASVTNVSCTNANNGAIRITPGGGTAPFTYSWQPGGQTTALVTNLANGSYTVIVKDANGCSTTKVVTITQPTPLTVNLINQVNVSCFGGNNGSVWASPAGGTPNYTYSWTPGGSTNANLLNATAGTYTVKVTDNKSCVATNTVTITQPASITVTNTITNVACSNNSNGSISIGASGGVPSYSYTWLPGGQTASSITGQAAGNYSVTVTDSKGCQKTMSYAITQPLPISVSLTQTNVSCFGAGNGAASASVTGGTSPYTYSWSPGGSTSPNVSGLNAVTYTLVVKDQRNCSSSNTLAITQPPVIALTSSVTNETCNYLDNGTATVTATGGTGPYNYLWSPGGYTTASVSNLASGSYTAAVTDNMGCIKTKVITVTQPASLTVNFINQVNVKCFGGITGSIGSGVSGGTPSYSYTWNPGGQHTTSLLNIPAGTYTMNVKDSKGCLTQNTVTITQPPALTVSVSSQSTTCYGMATGTISANGAGGTPSYNYTWTPGNLTGQTISNVGAGTYTVKIVDVNACVTTKTVLVGQPAKIVPVTTSTNSTCGNANGIGSVSVSGGLAPYTYTWTPTGGNSAVSTGLLAGSYIITVADANGCQGSQSLNINDSGGPVASIFSITNVSCHGGADGSATAGVTGGLAPITFSWSPYGGTSATATGLTAGVYYVTVTDANGCVSLATTSPEITEPPAITPVIATSNVSCFGGTNGSATITAAGGTPGYTYTWTPGAVTGSVITSVSAGNYSVQIMDANNCPSVATYTISQPSASVSIAVSSTSVSCFGGGDGSLSGLASGGTGPYTYNWQPGNFFGPQIANVSSGNYTVTVTDANSCIESNTLTVSEATQITLTTGGINSNCTLSNGQVSVAVTGGTGTYSYTWSPSGGNSSIEAALMASTYTVDVSDANNCMASATQVIADNPAPAVSVVETASVSCFGGSNASLSATVVGGTGPFTYTWAPSGGNNQVAGGLSSGSYSVTVTAANGCTVSATSSLIPQPIQLFSVISTSNVGCFGGSTGSATVTAGGGTSGYTYLWLPGATGGSVVTNQNAGTYSVQITDANNCVLTSTYSISQPSLALLATTTATTVSCFGGNNGVASANVSGGTGPYNYNWLPMSVNSTTIGGLTTGTYTVDITDLNSCATSATVLVTEPTQSLSATANGVATSCSGGSDGTATVTPTGGTSGYSYQWSPSGGSSNTASGLIQGTYIVTITDANSCQTNISVNISSPAPVTGSLTVLNPACGLSNGSINSQVTGGTGPYSYTWSPSSINTSTIGNLAPGAYSLQVMDSYQCAITVTTNLVNVPGPSVLLVSTVNDSCYGGISGSATIGISQGTAPYTINWAPFGGTATTAVQLSAGVYTANVTDDRGCLNAFTVNINEPLPVSVSINSVTNVSCFNGSNGAVTVSASGGTPSYTYSWSPAGSGPTISNLSAGIYTVLVKDSHFCTASISMGVTEPTLALTSTISNVVNLLCFNSTGSASSSVSGGTAPYTYTWSTVPVQNGSTASNISSGTYTVNIRDNNGCTASNTVTLTRPTEIFSNGGINDTICLGQSASLVASANGGAGNYYYVWQPVNVTNSGTLSVNPTSNTNYTVVAFDQNGCAGLPDTVKAVVYKLTQANLQVFGLSPICPGQSSILSANVTGSTGPIAYSWSNGLGNGAGPYIVSPSQPTTYVVNVLNSCGITVKDSVSIAFNPPPTLNASSNGTLICVPGTVNFFDNSVTGNVNDPITSWHWDFGDGTFSNSQNADHFYSSSGTYTVSLTITTDGGCTSNNVSSPITVAAYPYPDAIFTVNSTHLNLPYDVLVCTNQSVGASTYNWSFGDGGTSNATNPHYNYTSVGIYEVQLIATSQYGCSDTARIMIETNADIVFPNAFTPSSDGPSGGYYIPGSLDNDIFFPYTSGVIEYKFQVFDRWGELIFETEDVKQGWDGYYRGKICQLGVYVWKAHVKLNNGRDFNKTGDVTLLR
jgi:gliding motility-associated-like protein